MLSPDVFNALSPIQRPAVQDDPVYAGSTCKACRSDRGILISIGRTRFQLERETAYGLAEQIAAALSSPCGAGTEPDLLKDLQTQLDEARRLQVAVADRLAEFCLNRRDSTPAFPLPGRAFWR